MEIQFLSTTRMEPSYLLMEDNSLRVVGVTSRAYDWKVDCITGSIDVRVDGYLDWIEHIKENSCARGERIEEKCNL